ncbi:MAG: LysE family translocator [Pseudomonadota bacterium]
MLDPTLATAFLVVAFAVALSPGPDVMFVLASGMQHKTRGALASALGICVGSVVHALAAALGVSALIASSPTAFLVLQYLGAAYLAWLGFKAFRQFLRPTAVKGAALPQTPTAHVFGQALVTNLLNPKVIVFYLALLPQFVSLPLGQVGLQIFLLGAIHATIGLVYLVVIGCVAGRASHWLRTSGFARWLDAVAGTVFLGLALRLALTGRPTT